MPKYYILENKAPVPSTLLEMNAWFRKNRTELAFTRVGSVGVRTAFIGVNQAFGPEEPQVFETRIDGEAPVKTRFWSSWSAAEAGHQKVVDEVRQLVGAAD